MDDSSRSVDDSSKDQDDSSRDVAPKSQPKLLNNDSIDICESCGESISFKRLLARPVTTLCIDCKEQHEHQEAAIEQSRGGALDATAAEDTGTGVSSDD